MTSISITGRIILCISFIASTAGGQEIRRLSLEGAIRTAVASNHELISAGLEVERSDARVHEAWGYALPSIDLSGRFTRAIKKSVFFFPNIFAQDSSRRNQLITIEMGADNAYDLTMTATQVLFNSAVFTGVGTAQIYSRAAREVYRAKEVETVTNARKAFYGVLLAGAVKEMMESNLQNAEENFQNVRILAGQGLVSEYDELRAEVGLENLRPEVMRAQNNHVLALNNLKIVTGIPFDARIEIEGLLDFQPVDSNITSTAIESVVDKNPSLAALRHQSEVNDAIVSIERSSYLPSLAAFGNYQFQAQKNDWKISTNDFVRSSLVGLSLSLNLFNGFRTTSRVEQAQLEVKKSQQTVASTETSLRTAVQSIVLQLDRTRQRIEAQQRTVQQAGKGYRIATARFKSGASTQLEVNDAQLALTQAKLNRIQAIYDYLVASAELDQALGRLPASINSSIED